LKTALNVSIIAHLETHALPNLTGAREVAGRRNVVGFLGDKMASDLTWPR